MITAKLLKKYFPMDVIMQMDTKMVHALRDAAEEIEKLRAKEIEKSNNQQQEPQQQQFVMPNFGDAGEFEEIIGDMV